MRILKDIFLFIFISFSIPSFAGIEGSGFITSENDEVKTLSGKKGQNGGYGALSVGYTKIND